MKKDIPLYEKAAAIAIKLQIIDEWIVYRPEWILRKAKPQEIDFYYEKMCCGAE